MSDRTKRRRLFNELNEVHNLSESQIYEVDESPEIIYYSPQSLGNSNVLNTPAGPSSSNRCNFEAVLEQDNILNQGTYLFYFIFTSYLLYLNRYIGTYNGFHYLTQLF